MLTTRPRGTNDLLPAELVKWHYVENILHQVASLYGYQEIRTPIFEHTELFQRGVGESTDIVEKEMYTFIDRGERSLTLRPEATASTVRAFLEHKLYAGPLPVKLYYIGPMFRYDRPQAGRYRQFHQFGVEAFGAQDPSLDAEVIAMAMDIYQRLGLKNLVVELNSVGCPKCRQAHRQVLQEYLKEKLSKLCPTCQGRFARNPLRILDCKSEHCREVVAEAPTIDQMLCADCRSHFQLVQEYLQELQVAYTLNPRLVRGLDYYTKTAFEIVAQGIGAQSSIGGGGRYDHLIEECGGPSLPGIGYAMGIERIILTLEEQGIELPTEIKTHVFIAALGEKAQKKGAKLAQDLRQVGLVVERDYFGKSLKAQLKAANRLQAQTTVILGEEELAKEQAVVRKMEEGLQEVVPLGELVSYLVKGKKEEK
ncbi:MAG: histidine--tRNA ligase [Clostridia bacterium]|jgi:histidyl-tRNA synthetase|nr:histidine--tRNA ligase [Clostridia bacterium]